jgi:DNA-binding CsgD family transcriptional regulator
MRSSHTESDPPTLRRVAEAEGFAARVHQVLRQVVSVSDAAGAIEVLSRGVQEFGAASGCFVSFVREGDTAATCRMLLACDPRWGTEYLVKGWFNNDPWLSHALRSEEPIVASMLPAETPAEKAMVDRAAEYGFKSVVVAPSPSAAGASRAGVLYIGSERGGFFEGDGFDDVRPLRSELVARIRMSREELELLRHEDSGHGSKAIARALGTQAKTIDCRFQRINAKLGAPNRKAAVRIARLYGLL